MVDGDAYSVFLRNHAGVLAGCGVPEPLWPALHAKLTGEVFDAGERFEIQQVSEGVGERGHHVYCTHNAATLMHMLRRHRVLTASFLAPRLHPASPVPPPPPTPPAARAPGPQSLHPCSAPQLVIFVPSRGLPCLACIGLYYYVS